MVSRGTCLPWGHSLCHCYQQHHMQELMLVLTLCIVFMAFKNKKNERLTESFGSSLVPCLI